MSWLILNELFYIYIPPIEDMWLNCSLGMEGCVLGQFRIVWMRRSKTQDILRSEGGGELTPVEVPRSLDLMIFVTRRRLVEEVTLSKAVS